MLQNNAEINVLSSQADGALSLRLVNSDGQASAVVMYQRQEGELGLKQFDLNTSLTPSQNEINCTIEILGPITTWDVAYHQQELMCTWMLPTSATSEIELGDVKGNKVSLTDASDRPVFKQPRFSKGGDTFVVAVTKHEKNLSLVKFDADLSVSAPSYEVIHRKLREYLMAGQLLSDDLGHVLLLKRPNLDDDDDVEDRKLFNTLFVPAGECYLVHLEKDFKPADDKEVVCTNDIVFEMDAVINGDSLVVFVSTLAGGKVLHFKRDEKTFKLIAEYLVEGDEVISSPAVTFDDKGIILAYLSKENDKAAQLHWARLSI